MRHSRPEIYFALVAGAAALGILIAAAKAPLRATETAAAETDARCVAPPDLARLQLPLTRTARHLAARKLTLVVALGSSSTAGAGASTPAAAYPRRLMDELGATLPDAAHHGAQPRR